MMRVSVEPGAKRDLQVIYDFYENQQSGLGERVLTEIKAEAAGLADYPRQGRQVARGLRRLVMPRFHIGVFYRVQNDTVAVLMIEDLRRDPDTIRDKLARR